jgi:hypothetical protein
MFIPPADVIDLTIRKIFSIIQVYFKIGNLSNNFERKFDYEKNNFSRFGGNNCDERICAADIRCGKLA